MGHRIAIDIGNKKTKIIVGNSKMITHNAIIDTPENSFEDNRLTDMEKLYDSISRCITKNNIKTKNVSFCIRGQDIFIRHIEVPIMEKKSLTDSVLWETNQYLPEGGVNYYIDFEILDKEITSDKKVYKILTVAAPKEKVDLYAHLANKLNLKLESIDISANCISRFFANSVKDGGQARNIGIIDIGSRSSSIIIMDRGKLVMERDVPFGLENLVREIARRHQMEMPEAFRYLMNNFSFDQNYQDAGVDNRIQELFDNVCSSFLKVIQFCLTERNEKSLNKIYIIGGGGEMKGVQSYLSKYLGTPVDTINSPEKLLGKLNYPSGWDLKLFINSLGLALRKE